VEITVVILTFNEAPNITRCVNSCHFASRVLVVDSGSSDETVSLAKQAGADVVEMDWLGYGAQRERVRAGDYVTSDWLMWVDADEFVSVELAQEVSQALANPGDYVAFRVPLRFVFQGHQIKHCGWNKTRKTIVIRRDRCSYEALKFSERPEVCGAIGEIQAPIFDDDRKGLGAWLKKQIDYAELEASQLDATQTDIKFVERLSVFRKSRQTDARPLGRAIARDLVLPQMPLPGMLTFLYMYGFRLGFLDGVWGLRFCTYIAAQRMTVRALQNSIAHAVKQSEGQSEREITLGRSGNVD
jgi:glycosyltransferase involved in cell wall biosynthesis